jgi:ParB family chromosome partitioning protein
MSETTIQPDPIFGAGDIKEIVWVDMAEILPDPQQPRKEFDQDSIAELAASIAEHGLLQPVTVRRRPDGEGYYLILGERRFRAHQHLGRQRIEAIILREVSEARAFELALIENLQREDLPAVDVAAGYARLKDEFGYTDEQIADRLKKGRTTVTQLLSINRLPEKIKQEARRENIRKSTLIELAQLSDEAQQLKLWERAKKGFTVKEARLAKQEGATKASNGKAGKDKTDAQLRTALDKGREFSSVLSKLDNNKVRSLSSAKRQYESLLKLLEQIEQKLRELRPAEAERAPSPSPEEAAREEERAPAEV